MAASTDIETIKNRIAAMLATAANDGSTANEKAVAMQMASALMRRYNLEREDVEDVKKKEDYNSLDVNTLWARLTPWESRLAAFVAAYIVKGVFCVAGKEGASRRLSGSVGQAVLSFVGLGEDPGMAVVTFNQLRQSLLDQCGAKYGSPVRGDGRSYAVGFVNGLYKAAQDAEKLEKDKGEMSRALIRTDMLKEASKNWYLSTDENIRLKSSSRRLSGLNSEAYGAGYKDGQNTNREKSRPIAGLLN